METRKVLLAAAIAAIFLFVPLSATHACKNHLKVTYPALLQTLNHYQADGRVNITCSYMFFDPLVERDAKTGKIKPHLATSWKTIDPLTWEYKLKSGVKFHNGSPLNAECVRFTVMERLLDPAQKSPQVPGFKWIKEIKVIDDLTFRVISKKPYPLALERFNTLFIMDPKWTKDMVAKHGEAFLSRNVNGTGPYKVVKFKEGSHLELVRNENYWKKGVPAFPKMTIRFIKEEVTRLSEIISGGIDDALRISPDNIPLILKHKNLKLTEAPILRIYYWQFDGDLRAPGTPEALKDVRVRRAICHAIDRKTIISSILGGHATPIDTPINPMAFGADTSIPFYEYNPQKAKALMKEAGYENGFVLPVYSIQPIFSKLHEATMPYLEKINIKLDMRPYHGRYPVLAKIWVGGKADGVVGMSWGSFNVFDADAIWPYHFSLPDAPYNYNHNKELSDLLHDAGQSVDPAKRKALYSKAQKIIVDQAYWMPWNAVHRINATNKHFEYEFGPDEVPRWQYGVWKE